MRSKNKRYNKNRPPESVGPNKTKIIYNQKCMYKHYCNKQTEHRRPSFLFYVFTMETMVVNIS